MFMSCFNDSSKMYFFIEEIKCLDLKFSEYLWWIGFDY